jgi:CRP-like cAMP-binding protein
VADSPNQVSISFTDLWQMLSGFDAFNTFTGHERESFQHAFEHEVGMRVRRFAAGGVICRKGEFELDLCIVLSGRAEVHDEDDAGVHLGTLYEAGSIFGELGAMGGRPRSLKVIAAGETLILYITRN